MCAKCHAPALLLLQALHTCHVIHMVFPDYNTCSVTALAARSPAEVTYLRRCCCCCLLLNCRHCYIYLGQSNLPRPQHCLLPRSHTACCQTAEQCCSHGFSVHFWCFCPAVANLHRRLAVNERAQQLAMPLSTAFTCLWSQVYTATCIYGTWQLAVMQIDDYMGLG